MIYLKIRIKENVMKISPRCNEYKLWDSKIMMRLDNEKNLWIKDFYKSIGNALFLAEQEDDTSLRQGFVLLDNLVERFLKYYLIKIKNIDKSRLTKFPIIVEIAKEKIRGAKILLDRINSYHTQRNSLYHKEIFQAISKETFISYLQDVYALCEKINFIKETPKKILENSNEIIGKIISKRITEEFDSRLYNQRRFVDYLIKDTFRIPPGDYEGDIFLGCVPSSTKDGFDAFRTLLLGMLNREDSETKKVRVLELIDSNVEEPFHSYLLSYYESSTWYCIIDCFWSRNFGEGKRHPIPEIRKIINENIEYIDYEVKMSNRKLLSGIFDPLYAPSRDRVEYKDCFLKTSYYHPNK